MLGLASIPLFAGLHLIGPQDEAGFAFPARAVSPNTFDLAAAQLDGDGIADVVALSADGVTLLFGRGDGTFETGVLPYPSLAPAVAEPADLDRRLCLKPRP